MPRRALQSLILTAAVVLSAVPAGAQAPEPYVDPPWAETCEVHEFGEGEAPAAGSLDDDPLCVRYAKEDITVDNGGALAFLAGEPERVMAAVPACAYWQQDRWSVQLSTGTLALVSWEGSYWFDRGAGTAAAILRDFQIAGQPAGADQVADLLEAVDPEWAQTLREYGAGPGGGAGGFMSFGGGDPSCAAASQPDPAEPDEDPAADDGQDGTAGDPEQPAPAPAPTLPTTGGGALSGAAIAAMVIGLGAWRALHGRRGPGGP